MNNSFLLNISVFINDCGESQPNEGSIPEVTSSCSRVEIPKLESIMVNFLDVVLELDSDISRFEEFYASGLFLNTNYSANTEYNFFNTISKQLFLSGELFPELVAHELSHALLESFETFSYSYETGALMEGFCDILGVIVQSIIRIDQPDTWWRKGCSYETIYNFSNITHYDNLEGGADMVLQDIHSTTAIVSKVFFLLSEGGVHPNKNQHYQTQVLV